MVEVSVSDMSWLYITESKGIQNYILNTNKLKHMVGASQIISDLPKDFLEKCLNAFNLENDYKAITQAAGRAVILFKPNEKLNNFYAAWPLLVQEFAPNLEIVQTLVRIENQNLNKARLKAQEQLLSLRQRQNPVLPLPGPLSERCRRDGFAAVKTVKHEGPVSAEIARKLEVAENSDIKNELLKYFSNRFKKWPEDFNRISGDEKNYLAVIHADANGMGKILKEVNEKLVKHPVEKSLEITRKISAYIQDSAFKAASEATERTFEELKAEDLVPLRPLVLAGDDLTLVIKARYALKFIKTYIKSFEKHSENLLQEIMDDLNIEFKGFSVSAGIVFIRSSFPFKAAYELCEELCKKGKELSDRNYSTVSFWRHTNSSTDSYQNILDRELTLFDQSENKKVILTEQAYAVDVDKDLAALEDIEEIVSAMKHLPSGSLRQLATECYIGRNAANKAWQRFCDIAREKTIFEPSTNKNVFENFTQALIRISKNNQEPIWRKLENQEYSFATPLLDAVELYSVTSKGLREE